MKEKTPIRNAPYRAMAVFLAVTVVTLVVPIFLAGELLDLLPPRMQTTDMAYGFGILGSLIGVLLFTKAWRWFNLSEYFMRWDTYMETIEYPMGDSSE